MISTWSHCESTAINKIQYIIFLLQHTINLEFNYIGFKVLCFLKAFMTRSRFLLHKPTFLPFAHLCCLSHTNGLVINQLAAGHLSVSTCGRQWTHTQQSAHVLNINWKVGLRVRVGKLLTCEHTEAPYVSEDTRVRFTEQISGHYSPYDPGLYRGHLDYHTDGWTQPKHTNTAGRLYTGKYKADIWIFTWLKLANSSHLQDIKNVWMEEWCKQNVFLLKVKHVLQLFSFKGTNRHKSCCKNALNLIFHSR